MTHRWEVLHADCLAAMAAMEPNSVDAFIGDPPYGLTQDKRGGSGVASINLDSPYGRARIGAGNGPGGFMGCKWDSCVPGAEFWAEALRVAKPGAHLLMCGGTRTYHRLACAVEDAGWELRDTIAWCYGSGFPKSLDVGKAIDKAAGAVRDDLGPHPNWREGKRGNGQSMGRVPNEARITAPATSAAQQWDGWGTALKPAYEPIILARKPLVGTVAANVLRYGTGALNVGACRVGEGAGGERSGYTPNNRNAVYGKGMGGGAWNNTLGRWPANLIHDGSPEVLAIFPQQKSGSRKAGVRKGLGYHGADGDGGHEVTGSKGSAARFFYCAKPSTSEREAGLGALPVLTRNRVNPGGLEEDPKWGPVRRRNDHPTVKPIALMRYLCRLITPPGGLVLDPFCGSGTTGCAAVLEGFRFVGVELDEHFAEIARARIAHWAGRAGAPSPPPAPDAQAGDHGIARQAREGGQERERGEGGDCQGGSPHRTEQYIQLTLFGKGCA